MKHQGKAKLLYSMLVSLDGYTEDAQGNFDWAAPKDEQVHASINALAFPVGTYLYGRRMYETMLYWETAHLLPNQPKVILDWAHHWQAAEKIVFSRTLQEPACQRTQIERKFDSERVRQLKDEAKHDLAIAGPELAMLALQAGLVDEFQLIICPVIVGGGKRFFPDGVRVNLTLIEQRSLGNGVIFLRYAAGS